MVEYSELINKDISVEDAITRNVLDKQNVSEEFKLNTNQRKYDKQYFSMYQYRFKNLKDRIHINSLEKWGDGTKKVDGQLVKKQDKILDITSGQLCWVIGTVFCDLKNKLNILQDVEKGTDDIIPNIPDSYIGDDDDTSLAVMIEDESGRAILHNEEFLQKNILVSGCIVGVLGIEIQAGIFEIMDIAYPTFAPQPPLSLETGSGNNKIALISGLNIDYHVNDIKLDLLTDILTGELGSEKERDLIKSISKLIIAGDSIRPLKIIDNGEDFVTTNNYGSKIQSRFDSKSVEKFDKFLSEILPSLPISIMPGNNDIAEICLPQQPLHKSTFHNNYQFLSDPNYLQNLTNPQWFEINGIKILGTAGQNVEDILRYINKSSDVNNEEVKSDKILSIMESQIKWQNFVPTAPDTLYCYPYDDFDPFIFEKETPHVYFVGNQPKFGSEWYKYDDDKFVRLISIPKFSETGEIILLDLDNLQTEVIKISV
ncbi:DNA polymerase delta small subunit [Scheffersomyces coipomensis]|uniref:DNA polymerase delta small subunit n=1 Tax=Scheffersomyces coipomensis TaxID=1788519 RepID=UPI00315C98E3